MSDGLKLEIVDDWRKDATSDKGFLDVFKKSLFIVGSPIDFYAFILLIILGVIASFWVIFDNEEIISQARVAIFCQKVGAYGSAFSLSILGFLIAGFSIFSTMIKPEYFQTISKFKSSGRSISEFKFVFYNFLYIFAHYGIYLFICAFVTIFFTVESPVWYLFDELYNSHPKIVKLLELFFSVILVSYTFYAILLLRSFIWNMYQGMLFAIFFPSDHGGDDGKV